MTCDVCKQPMSEDETGYLHVPSEHGGHVACMRYFIMGWNAAFNQS